MIISDRKYTYIESSVHVWVVIARILSVFCKDDTSSVHFRRTSGWNVQNKSRRLKKVTKGMVWNQLRNERQNQKLGRWVRICMIKQLLVQIDLNRDLYLDSSTKFKVMLTRAMPHQLNHPSVLSYTLREIYSCHSMFSCQLIKDDSYN